MPKRFYLATKKDRVAEANAISAVLKTHGWERTLTWTSQDDQGPDHLAKVAQDELEAVRNADVLIVMLPAGRGTHIETGIALAMEKLVIIHAPSREKLDDPYPCPFHYLPGVKIIISESLDADAILACLPA
jgi:nucleoside 2-deoxyribosyltransferase